MKALVHSTSFTTASPGISCRDGTCLHNVGGQYRVEISWKYSTLLWFTAMTITVCGRHPTESVTGVQQSAAAVLLSLLDLYWVIPSYTEDWMSAACCCYGLAILLPQLEHQFLFFIGASDRVFRKLFHFKIVRNLLNIYHGIMCYCCFFCANTFARWELMKYPLKHLWIINSKKNWPWFSTQQIYGLAILFSKL